MKSIKVLGPGCKKCKLLEENVKQALTELKSDVPVEKVEDMETMVGYGMMSSPGLVIDEKLILSGKVPSVEELKEMFKA